MTRNYRDLLSHDPAWPALAEEAAKAPNGTVVLPPESEGARRSCLEALQVTTRSTLGAIAHETGGLLVDDGWLRILGCGHAKLPRRIGDWNRVLEIPLEEALVVADDVVGGIFAINGGALGEHLGNVYYFAPDALGWEDTELGHSDFVSWAFEGDLERFYESVRWDGWRTEVAALDASRAYQFWPPLWSEEQTAIADRDRRAVPIAELWRLAQNFAVSLRAE